MYDVRVTKYDVGMLMAWVNHIGRSAFKLTQMVKRIVTTKNSKTIYLQ